MINSTNCYKLQLWMGKIFIVKLSKFSQFLPGGSILYFVAQTIIVIWANENMWFEIIIYPYVNQLQVWKFGKNHKRKVYLYIYVYINVTIMVSAHCDLGFVWHLTFLK